MSYMLAYGHCIRCGREFGFNPDLVPSIRIKGIREPICKACVERVNPIRKEKGLDPIVPHPNAYEAQEGPY
jgi:hypothetical protein